MNERTVPLSARFYFGNQIRLLKMVDNSDTYIDILIKTGIFDPHDLEINRSGHLSNRQKRTLFVQLSVWMSIIVIEVSALMFFVYIQITTHGNLLIGVIGLAFLLVLIHICLEEAKPFWDDIREDKPRTTSGKIHKSFGVSHGTGRGQRVAYCSIRVGDQVFSVSPATYDRVNEDIHRIYYVTNTKRVINIEPL
jgi:hypothetical protein